MPNCPTTLSGPRASQGWEKDRPASVEKCQGCGTCYPERYIEDAAMVNGVCITCRGKEDSTC